MYASILPETNEVKVLGMEPRHWYVLKASKVDLMYGHSWDHCYRCKWIVLREDSWRAWRIERGIVTQMNWTWKMYKYSIGMYWGQRKSTLRNICWNEEKYNLLTRSFCLKNPKLIKRLEDGSKAIKILILENLNLSSIQRNKKNPVCDRAFHAINMRFF